MHTKLVSLGVSLFDIESLIFHHMPRTYQLILLVYVRCRNINKINREFEQLLDMSLYHMAWCGCAPQSVLIVL